MIRVVNGSLSNISQLGVLFPIYGKIMKNKHVPNHQSDGVCEPTHN
jgi:hypothetical protein